LVAPLKLNKKSKYFLREVFVITVNFISGGGSTNLAVLEAQKPDGKLHGLVRTAAIICNNSKAAGIQRAIEAGFPEKNIHLVGRYKGDLGEQIVEILEKYQPEFYHQLGWMPLMPNLVMENFLGLNQHLGPGGKFMYGERRLHAHIRFCEIIGEKRPVPIFCQVVDPVYDNGDAISVRFENILEGETIEEAAKRFLPIEHEVQIEALFRLATFSENYFSVPRVYETPEEKLMMDQARIEAHEFYCQKEKRAG
jgi:folate-dependent phosphoribosylglycinamide formyltransferase PurN